MSSLNAERNSASSAKEAVAVHAAPDDNHEVDAAGVSAIILQRNCVVIDRTKK